MSTCHHHNHYAGDGKRLIAAFVVIAVFMVVEALGGFLSGSLALLADATHMLTDALALALAASAQWIARRPADDRLHFGYRRTQVLAAFVNGIALAFLLAWIVFEAVKRFVFEPIDVNWSLMLIIATVGLLANGVAFFVLHGAEKDNVNIRGAMLHVLSDLLGSVAAIIAAVVIALTGWMKIDPILSILVAMLIGRSAWMLVRETGHILMEGAPQNIDVATLIDELREIAPQVEDVHHVQIWQLTPEETRLTMHARITAPGQTHETLQALKSFLEERYGIKDSTVQIEVGDHCPDCPPGVSPADAFRLKPSSAKRASRTPYADAPPSAAGLAGGAS
ncbi:MAG: cation diffusion facilitator family transporter [Pseudomonadota bacterium]